MKVRNTVRGTIGSLFLAFFVLVTASVAATFWGIQAQRMDALVINLAGRQRMLTQKITWLALAQPENPELEASVRLFEQTLRALQDGGVTYYGTGSSLSSDDETLLVILPAVSDPGLRAELDQVVENWSEFRQYLQPVDAVALQRLSPILLARLDVLVSRFEAKARAKLFRVQIIQAFSFIGALVLLGLGYWVTQRRVLYPLTQLQVAAQRLAQGELEQPLPPMGDDELGEVGHAFEVMRQQITATHQELETHVAQRTRELVAAFEFSQEIITQLDLERLLQAVTDRARTLTRARSAALCLLDEEKESLGLTVTSGHPLPPLSLHQNLHHDPAYQVVAEGCTVTLCTDCAQCGFLLAQQPGQCAVVPLRARETILGALCVVRDAGAPFDADETRALTLLANVAAIAIINAHLAEDGRKQAAQAAILTERERLAGELHDNLAQTLGFLNLQTDRVQRMLTSAQVQCALEELDKVKSAVEIAYNQVRGALVGLSECITGTDDFLHRLKTCLEEIGQRSGQHIELQVGDTSTLHLSRLAQEQTLLILREAVTNISKHAHARNVCVRLERDDGQVRLTVEDDGVGFDPQEIINGGHLGLRLMRARAERSGGTLTVESAPGAGTRVTVSFALEELT
ncbi:MAG: ATP-binding protein [Anaerolineales bacterium]